MLIGNLLTTLLQMFNLYMVYSKVIFKSVVDPEELYQGYKSPSMNRLTL